jgi:TldD protein
MVDRGVLEEALSAALAHGGDFAEVFVERKAADNLRLEDRKVESFTSGTDQGVGLRVISGASTYFIHADTLDPAAVIAAARELAEAIKAQRGSNSAPPLIRLSPVKPLVKHIVKIAPSTIEQAAKADIARRADVSARATAAEIQQVTVMLADSVQNIEVANSVGVYAADKRTLTRIFVFAVTRSGERVESAHEAPGIQGGFELFDEHTPENVGRAAAERAQMLLGAVEAPSGGMPVVLGNGTGGVLFHEASGHGLEADAIRKGASVFAGRIGEAVAADCVSAADDPSLPNRWGSFSFDDEGVPARENLLIKDGILQGFMYDRLTARLAGAEPTPNGRRQSFRHVPIPRMTNTFIKPGSDSLEAMLEGVKKGLYAKALGGGEVNPATGDYVFGVTEGYLIEDGKITSPVRGAVLVGNGPQTLLDIQMVGSDLDFDAGMCGKGGQSVPAGTGQPSLKIKQLTVGGTGG